MRLTTSQNNKSYNIEIKHLTSTRGLNSLLEKQQVLCELYGVKYQAWCSALLAAVTAELTRFHGMYMKGRKEIKINTKLVRKLQHLSEIKASV